MDCLATIKRTEVKDRFLPKLTRAWASALMLLSLVSVLGEAPDAIAQSAPVPVTIGSNTAGTATVTVGVAVLYGNVPANQMQITGSYSSPLGSNIATFPYKIGTNADGSKSATIQYSNLVSDDVASALAQAFVNAGFPVEWNVKGDLKVLVPATPPRPPVNPPVAPQPPKVVGVDESQPAAYDSGTIVSDGTADGTTTDGTTTDGTTTDGTTTDGTTTDGTTTDGSYDSSYDCGSSGPPVDYSPYQNYAY